MEKHEFSFVGIDHEAEPMQPREKERSRSS
jgi:hypothetical protein